jgi:acyl-CoA synthetase (AMP-forming)/AMP-acid ligase II
VEPSYNLVEMVERWGREKPDELAARMLVDGEHEEQLLTFGELLERSGALAVELLRECVPGDRVVVLLPTSLEFLISFTAVLRAGLVAVPLQAPHPRRFAAAAANLGRVFESCKPRVVLTTSEIAAARTDGLEASWALSVPSWRSVSEPLAGVAGAQQLPRVAPTDLALLQYTSGSTSAPKGVMLTHGNIATNQRMLESLQGVAAGHTAAGSWLPHYHDMGLAIILFGLCRGIPTTLMSPMHFVKRAARWPEMLSRYQISFTVAPSFALDLCAERVSDELASSLDLSGLRCMIIGAEPIAPETLRAFARRFAPAGFDESCIAPCYGLAETTVFATGASARVPRTLFVEKEAYRRGRIVPAASHASAVELVSCGQPGPGHRILICDPDTRTPLKELEVGEIWLAGGSVSTGYWGLREESEANLQAVTATGERAFLRTGDLGFVWRGELYVTGRRKDLIIVRGRNIYPQDIENLLASQLEELRAGRIAAFGELQSGTETVVIVAEASRRKVDREELQRVASTARRIVQEAFEVEVSKVVIVPPGSLAVTSSSKLRRGHYRAQIQQDQLDPLAVVTSEQDRLGSLSQAGSP